jgi:SAM-dependent methyltransferase
MQPKDTLENCVANSLDGNSGELLPFFPYLLQDLWEIGAEPETMIRLVKENVPAKKLKILDLGCGKGAISVNMAKELDCMVLGIDAIPEFIDEAKTWAEKYDVQQKCTFLVGDIRQKINELQGFDLVVLGAIGPVLGNIQETLTLISGMLATDGYILLDDSYLPISSNISYNRCPCENDFFQQIDSAGFEIIEESIFDRSSIETTDDEIFSDIERRAKELSLQFPDKKALFDGYVESQRFEYQMLKEVLVSGTWLLKRGR